MILEPSAAVILIGASQLARGLQIVAVSNAHCCHLFLRDSSATDLLLWQLLQLSDWKGAVESCWSHLQPSWAQTNARAALNLRWSGHAGLQQELGSTSSSPGIICCSYQFQVFRNKQGLSES